VWVWWVMGCLCHVDWYPDLYPGDRYVDWVSYDPYDFNLCRNTGYKTPAQSVLPFLGWLNDRGLGNGKPVMLSEFGSHGTDRGAWYRGLDAVVKSAPRIRAIVSFDSHPAGCDTRVTASQDNWQGFVDIAVDPYYNQRLRIR
jgi:beta-mannanase